jgi:hypothetical protein
LTAKVCWSSFRLTLSLPLLTLCARIT